MAYTAYANSADGIKDFTKVKPKPNLYNSSLLNSAPSIVVEETGFKLLGGWATPVINHANLRKILKVGHTYHFSYDFELLTLQEGTVPHTQYQHTTLFLYSTKDSRNYPGIMLTQYATASGNLFLKEKSEEAKVTYLAVWDDITKVDAPIIKEADKSTTDSDFPSTEIPPETEEEPTPDEEVTE